MRDANISRIFDESIIGKTLETKNVNKQHFQIHRFLRYFRGTGTGPTITGTERPTPAPTGQHRPALLHGVEQNDNIRLIYITLREIT